MLKDLKFPKKIFAFLIVFSAIFYWIHVGHHYNTRIILADLGGVPWLYSSIVMLFSILAGFVIQKEWENWNSLLDSVKGEVSALRELWFWSRHLPLEFKSKFNVAIRGYVLEMSKDGLDKSARGEKSEQVEKAFTILQNVMFEMSKGGSHLFSTTFSFFTKLLEFRSSRLRYSAHNIPKSLRSTLIFTTFLLIALSLFIGIKDIWLDYIFTTSMALVSFIIYIVIDDLDHPLIPGNWHLTSKDYEELLSSIIMIED